MSKASLETAIRNQILDFLVDNMSAHFDADVLDDVADSRVGRLGNGGSGRLLRFLVVGGEDPQLLTFADARGDIRVELDQLRKRHVVESRDREGRLSGGDDVDLSRAVLVVSLLDGLLGLHRDADSDALDEASLTEVWVGDDDLLLRDAVVDAQTVEAFALGDGMKSVSLAVLGYNLLCGGADREE